MNSQNIFIFKIKTGSHNLNMKDKDRCITICKITLICNVMLTTRIQKQPSKGALRERRPENMRQIYRRTPMPKCDVQSNFIEIALRHGCSYVKLLHIFRTLFYRNTYGGLFLNIWSSTFMYKHVQQLTFFKWISWKLVINHFRK